MLYILCFFGGMVLGMSIIGAVMLTLYRKRVNVVLKEQRSNKEIQEETELVFQLAMQIDKEEKIGAWCKKKEVHTIVLIGINRVTSILIPIFKSFDVDIIYCLGQHCTDSFAGIDVKVQYEAINGIDALIVVEPQRYTEELRRYSIQTRVPILSLTEILN